MRQRQFGHGIDIVHSHFTAPFQRRQRARGAQHHQVGTHAVHTGSDGARRGMVQHRYPGVSRPNTDAEEAPI